MLLEILYIIFGISIFALFWTYAGYPVFLWILSKIIKRREHKYDENYQPNVSIIIPCYNEEKVIKKKLENTLELNYPKEKIEILVVDDGSTDNTSKIVEDFIKENKLQNVRIIRQEIKGKGEAMNSGIKNSKYEIIAICDAN
ncbi:MAG: glycosyltransferase, partial [Candidatus Altarchaeaceae archaeon]